MEQVRIGFIGCGGNARGHMARLRQLPQARIVAVCDVVPEAANRAAGETGATPYTDHRALLERDDLDAVYLSLPVFAHGQPELDTIARGLPFFVEKPVALTMQTALTIAQAVEKAGLLTCVGYQLRYLPHTAAVRSWLAGREVSMAVGHYWCGSGRGQGWVVQWQKSGGQLVEQATHTIDMMRYLVGEVEEVFSYQANRVVKQIDSPDVYVVAMRFASGALGSLTTAWHLDPRDWSQANILQIFYEQSRLSWSAGGASLTPADEAFAGQAVPGPSIDEVFVEAVRTGDRSRILTPYAEGVRSLAVSLAANLSAQRGQPVRISEVLESGTLPAAPALGA